MEYVFSPPPQVSVPVVGLAARFPVHRVYCVGRNYADHVAEMGGDPKSEPPVFFSKPASALVTDGDPVRYPQATTDLHHEVELVVALADGGRDLSMALVSTLLGEIYKQLLKSTAVHGTRRKALISQRLFRRSRLGRISRRRLIPSSVFP